MGTPAPLPRHGMTHESSRMEPTHDFKMTRREFIMTSTALAAVTATGQNAFAAPVASRLIGIQIAPQSLLDEGVGTCLDFLQEEGGINAIFCYSQTYHLGEIPPEILARDHPVPPRDPRGRRLPFQWVRLPEASFADLGVRHPAHDASAEYADRDLFAELTEACKARGIRVYARVLEAGLRRADRIPGYASVAAVRADGSPSHGPCWNHPEYREWIRRTVDETMRLYPLDGFQYGAERVGSLSEVLFKGGHASCFCQFCRARMKNAGVDMSGVETGFAMMEKLMERVARGETPVDGVLTEVIRVLFRHPEMLAFYDHWLRADLEIQRMVYETAKARRPGADVGQHVDHQRSSWDIFFRAAVPYADMAEHNDFIKPIVYHEVFGPRLKEWVIDAMQQRVLADLSREQSLGLFYAAFGHDAGGEPAYADLEARGLSAEYVFLETQRCVRGVAGRAKVYAGVGMDVPHYIPGGMRPMPSLPQTVEAATRRALEAGADGVLASREYHEISRSSLRAFGRAARAAS